ncbi:MAG: AMP-binding protein [Pseudomonadota bacterium]
MHPPSTSILTERIDAVLAAREHREVLTVVSRGQTSAAFTGASLRAQVNARADQLTAWLGGTGGVVVLAFPPGPLFVTSFLACLAVGVTAVPVPLPRRGSASERLRHIVEDCGAAGVLTTDEARPKVRAALGEDASIPVIALASGQDPAPCAAATEGRRAAVIQYTSGSTRWPKGVEITADNILANCDLVRRTWGFDETSRFVNWMPHFHDMGLMGGLLYPFLCGATSVQMSPYDFVRRPRAWLEEIAQSRATFSGGPAFAFADILARVGRDDLEGLDLTTWSHAYCGGEPVPPGLIEAVRAHLAPTGLRPEAVFSCYGMAEMTLFAAGRPDPAKDDEAAPADHGPDHACRLDDRQLAGIVVVDLVTLTAVCDGDEGEIWLTGPSASAGYVNALDETEAVFGQRLTGRKETFVRTGDLGRIDGRRLFITGRLKDTLIAHGRKVSAHEVEWLACRAEPRLNPLAAAAFMTEEAASGTAALVVETRGSRTMVADAQATRRAIRGAVLGEFGIDLVDIVFVPRGRLPRTTSGKTRRRAVAESWRDGAFAPAATVM